MDEQTARMIQQLKSNPAMLQALMQSRDGQALMQMLSGGDRGASLQRAAQSAAKGNPAEMVRMVNQLMQSPDGAALIDRINKTMNGRSRQVQKGGGPAVAEFDDKLNSILSNPDAMAQIMQLAQSLSGGTGGNNAANAPPPPPSQPGGSSPGWGQQPQTPPPSGGDPLSALAGGLDPQLLLRFLPLIQELGGARDSNARQLLYALRPYLKPERQEKVERALQLARLFHLGRKFLAGWEG